MRNNLSEKSYLVNIFSNVQFVDRLIRHANPPVQPEGQNVTGSSSDICVVMRAGGRRTLIFLILF